VAAGISARELVGRSARDRPLEIGRAVERAIVMDDDDAIEREVDIELEAVGAMRQAGVECRKRVLGREQTAAAVREDEGPRGREE